MEEMLTYKHIQIYLPGRSVKSSGQAIHLKPMEYDLLVTLIRHSGKTMSRDEILNAVWGSEYEGYSRTVDNHIAVLRRKLELSAHLITVSKVGYKLI